MPVFDMPVPVRGSACYTTVCTDTYDMHTYNMTTTLCAQGPFLPPSAVPRDLSWHQMALLLKCIHAINLLYSRMYIYICVMILCLYIYALAPCHGAGACHSCLAAATHTHTMLYIKTRTKHSIHAFIWARGPSHAKNGHGGGR